MAYDTNTAEREAFEAWAKGCGYQSDELARCKLGFVSPAYFNLNTENAWKAWQARASLAASAGSEPVARMASERDELFQAAIDFIRTLTGMEPPPIEVAPPDVLRHSMRLLTPYKPSPINATALH